MPPTLQEWSQEWNKKRWSILSETQPLSTRTALCLVYIRRSDIVRTVVRARPDDPMLISCRRKIGEITTTTLSILVQYFSPGIRAFFLAHNSYICESMRGYGYRSEFPVLVDQHGRVVCRVCDVRAEAAPWAARGECSNYLGAREARPRHSRESCPDARFHRLPSSSGHRWPEVSIQGVPVGNRC